MSELETVLSAIAAGASADSRETSTLEFKSDGRSRSDAVKNIAEAAACLANASGGLVIAGVRDNPGGVDAIEGSLLDADVLQRRVYELTTPPLIVEAREVSAYGVKLIEVRVPRSPEVHQVDNRASRRIGASCQPMSASQIASLVAERRNDDWSDEDSDLPISAAQTAAVDQARALLAAAPDPVRRRYATETPENLFRILGVSTPRGTFNRAGALLFTEPAATQSHIVYQFRRTPAGEPTLGRPEGPLLTALLRVLDLITARLDTTPVNLPGGQQVQLADLPEAAIREAVANAVIHRDHRLAGSVRIEHAPTRLSVTSPGPLVHGVTLANILTTSSRPRNARLAAAVRTLGLAEEAGVGVDRMYREMVRVGHLPPNFDETIDQVAVTLIGGAPNTHLARYVATLPSDETADADAMLTLYTLLTRRVIDAKALTPVLQKGVDEVEFVLRRLASEAAAMLEPTRETVRRAHPNYRLREHAIAALGPAITYRRRTTDEYDRKIIELVRASGDINARMVKVALDLTTVSASRVLGDLVVRGILVKTSDAQRGPSVTYGRGPAFPSSSRARKQSRRS